MSLSTLRALQVDMNEAINTLVRCHECTPHNKKIISERRSDLVQILDNLKDDLIPTTTRIRQLGLQSTLTMSIRIAIDLDLFNLIPDRGVSMEELIIHKAGADPHIVVRVVRNCGVNITPACYRALYRLPVGHINDSVNSPGLYEQGDYFSQSDVSQFLAMSAPNVPPSTAPVVLGIDGGQAPVPASDLNNNGESDIDIDIVLSLVYPQSVIVYQVDDENYAVAEVEKANTFNTFLDALDGSYCNYTAYGITGNSPDYDPTYPDPADGGCKGQLQCGVYKPTRVICISYGEAEQDFQKVYAQRQCNEFMKLGLQGHTILAASGDYGVASYPGDITPSGCLSGNGQNQTIYNPDYLSGCPWITSVGGTRLYPGQTILDRESPMELQLDIASAFVGSGGGFSNYYTTPSWQKSAKKNYFRQHDPGHPYYIANSDASNIGANVGIYNRAGRGFPNVSANGAFLPTPVNGTVYRYSGTSLSSPLWASVITLLNQQRTIAGKGPIGFLNPVLYAHPWVLNNIVNGTNAGCGSSGFKAVPGWDPVTGLGTPDYPRMLELFLSLP
ncbi:hypothetical protein M409DRAFT_26859 [Zasmidium cellare ATCC 36951]|uniref:Peptidase S53 domain-containing protein n=1 Tax=Zasmidium cellare ATCC 36951 TaxID=1080233 RepID=A0A6A6C619_ZASCE|nr:uncharacterized protein M409DRAFT_26859 [Zasmidium cellare ATCC 36951]KAF2162617.1 hypothetical protein M409DRAFT_26859 [Zasmidium cellare ATCC 36951]